MDKIFKSIPRLLIHFEVYDIKLRLEDNGLINIKKSCGLIKIHSFYFFNSSTFFLGILCAFSQ
jgi:hypothetical protein